MGWGAEISASTFPLNIYYILCNLLDGIGDSFGNIVCNWYRSNDYWKISKLLNYSEISNLTAMLVAPDAS